MDHRVALHTAARRHCQERHAYWAEAYRHLDARGEARTPVVGLKWEYSQEAYATFPRYLVWEAILNEIERLEPRSVPNADALRLALTSAGLHAETAFTTNAGLPSVARSAMTEEREEFRDFIKSLPEAELDAVELLPLRRVFGMEDLSRVWAHIAEKWDAKPGHGWWPLRDGTAPSGVIVFHTDWFDDAKVIVLRDLLSAHGIRSVWEVREFGEWGCEKDVGSLEPIYNGEEGYWTSEGSDWLIYASHESSVSLAGDWLVPIFRQRFPDSDQFRYNGPMSTPDKRGTW